MNGGHQEAQVLGQLLAHALDPCQQLTTLVAVDQGNQAIADFQADHVDRGYVIPAQLLGFHGAGRRRQQFLLTLDLFQRLDLLHILLFPEQVGGTCSQGRHAQERKVRHPRHQAHHCHQASRHGKGFGRGEHLTVDLLAHVFGARSSGDHDRRSCG